MSDPLSISCSIVGLISLGSNVCLQLYQFIGAVRSASSDARALACELHELCSLLRKLRDTFSNGAHHEFLWEDLNGVLKSCTEKFRQLEILIKAHTVKNGDGIFSQKWKQVKWTFHEKEMMALKSQLEAHKMTLSIALLLSMHAETSSVRDISNRIETTLQKVMVKLDQNTDPKITATQQIGTCNLKRYLSNASIAISTRTTPHLSTGEFSMGGGRSMSGEVNVTPSILPHSQEQAYQSQRLQNSWGLRNDVPRQASEHQAYERAYQSSPLPWERPTAPPRVQNATAQPNSFEDPLAPSLEEQEQSKTAHPRPQSLCSACRTPVQSDDKFIWDGGVIHGGCLNCRYCNNPTSTSTNKASNPQSQSQESASYYSRRCKTRGLYCVQHDPSFLAPRCSSCNQDGRLRESSRVVLMKREVQGTVVRTFKVRFMDFRCCREEPDQVPSLEWYMNLADEDVGWKDCLLRGWDRI